MFPKHLSLLLFFTSFIHAATWDLQYRYAGQTSHSDFQSLGALYNNHPFSWLYAQTGVRTTVSTKDLESIDYKFEALVPILSFLNLGARLSHSNHFPETTANSHLLGYGTLQIRPFSTVELFGTVGWYRRYVQLAKTTVLPDLFRHSYTEHDFALEVGTALTVSQDWQALLKLSTFEEFDIYNFNNPYAHAELGLRIHPLDWMLSIYGRYRVLLGFGRLDELSMGLRLVMGSLK